MSLQAAEKVIKALLYEGYILYPYYPQTTKNRKRWTFGGVYPRHYVEQNPGADASSFQAECLLEGDGTTTLEVRVPFLHLMGRPLNDTDSWDAWEEARERQVILTDLNVEELTMGPQIHPFAFGTLEVREENPPGFIQKPVFGIVRLSAVKECERLFRLRVQVENVTDEKPENRNEALLHTLVSTHVLMSVNRGRFLSQTDPPENYRAISEKCQNHGVWPVLIGKPGDDRVMVASPIILYDYPQIAPESPGDLFDGAEIDEILSLRILTLTDEEKTRMKQSGEAMRSLLERTENLSQEDWLKLHGRLRELSTDFKAGDRVRIVPRKNHAPFPEGASDAGAGPVNHSDLFDLALQGLTARVEAVEHSLEGETFLSVTFDDDPGRDLGLRGQPGHRFYFRPFEVERV